jgi:peptide/nickel transport system substrate-binding protein
VRQIVAALLAAAILVAAGCSEDDEPSKNAGARKSGVPVGGAARIIFVVPPGHPELTLDPQSDYTATTFALFRCCLGRTLLSYSGRPTEEGGATLRPDLAAAMPEVSGDGLTWTFRLKRGLRYGPPLEDTPIVTGDFIRALEREATVGQVAYAFYYTIIEGFGEFMDGKAGSISGLEAPDDNTLVIHLTTPSGDLGNMMSLPATAPIPPTGQDTDALGTAAGHDRGLGPFLVSSGPYMVEGSEDLGFTAPPKDQEPLTGLVVNESVRLVRNPSWRPDKDALRPAYPDKLEIAMRDAIEQSVKEVSRADADVVVNLGSPPLLPPVTLDEYQNDEDLRRRLYVGSRDVVSFITMNVAEPPFDDVHVRKAVNLVTDKTAIQDVLGGPVSADVMGHVFLNSMENNLLDNYDPYSTPDSAGDLAAAKKEMALSRYDRNADGVCDRSVCEGLVAPAISGIPGIEKIVQSITADLSTVGIRIDPQIVNGNVVLARLNNPNAHIPLGLYLGWAKDFPNASGFVNSLFTGETVGGRCCNWSLVGASPEQLKDAGYSTRSVPTIDDKVTECRALVGDAQIRCWAETDQLLMETVVPWVPLTVENQLFIVSERVVGASLDQFTTLPALDRLVIRR